MGRGQKNESQTPPSTGIDLNMSSTGSRSVNTDEMNALEMENGSVGSVQSKASSKRSKKSVKVEEPKPDMIQIARSAYDLLVEDRDDMKQKYEKLLKEHEELKKSKGGSVKSANSPDDGKYVRFHKSANRSVKCRYVDNKKDFVANTKMIGVSADQKNNSSKHMKVAEYDLIWVNTGIVKDTATGMSYPHRGGVFSVVKDDKCINVKMMYDITPV